MSLFLRLAPDLNSWRSGYFPFVSDCAQVRNEVTQAAIAAQGLTERWLPRFRSREVRLAELDRLTALIEDAKALGSSEQEVSILLEQAGSLAALAHRDALAASVYAELADLAARLGYEHQQRLAERQLARLKRRGNRLGSESSPARPFGRILIGPETATDAAELIGRKDEVHRLMARITAVEPRFLVVWGEAGCGKTALVVGGVKPQLSRSPAFLPVVVRQWGNAMAAVKSALADAAGSPDLLDLPLHDAVDRASRMRHATVVLLFDQFDDFFAASGASGSRSGLLEEMAHCVTDFRLPFRLLVVVRAPNLGRIAEFEPYLNEPLEMRKRSVVQPFTISEGAHVLRELSARSDLRLADFLVEAVIRDMAIDGRVQPFSVRLVAAALGYGNIHEVVQYDRAGRARGLLGDYLALSFASAAHPPRAQNWATRVLLSLVNDDRTLAILTAAEIEARTGLRGRAVASGIEALLDAGLISPAIQPAPSSAMVYRLTSEFLLTLVLDTIDPRVQARRAIARCEKAEAAGSFYVLGLRDLWNIARYAGDDQKKKDAVKRALRRTRAIYVLVVLAALVVSSLCLALVFRWASATAAVSADQGDVVFERSFPIPGISSSLRHDVVLDTGIPASEVKQDLLGHLRWFQSPDSLLRQTIEAMTDPVRKGLLLVEIGHEPDGLALLRQSADGNDSSITSSALVALGNVAILSSGSARATANAIMRRPPQEAASIVLPRLVAILGREKDGDASVKMIVDYLLNVQVANRDESDAVQDALALCARVALAAFSEAYPDGDSKIAWRAAAALAASGAGRNAPDKLIRFLDRHIEPGEAWASPDERRVAIKLLGLLASRDIGISRPAWAAVRQVALDPNSDDDLRSTAIAAYANFLRRANGSDPVFLDALPALINRGSQPAAALSRAAAAAAAYSWAANPIVSAALEFALSDPDPFIQAAAASNYPDWSITPDRVASVLSRAQLLVPLRESRVWSALSVAAVRSRSAAALRTLVAGVNSHDRYEAREAARALLAASRATPLEFDGMLSQLRGIAVVADPLVRVPAMEVAGSLLSRHPEARAAWESDLRVSHGIPATGLAEALGAALAGRTTASLLSMLDGAAQVSSRGTICEDATSRDVLVQAMARRLLYASAADKRRLLERLLAYRSSPSSLCRRLAADSTLLESLKLEELYNLASDNPI